MNQAQSNDTPDWLHTATDNAPSPQQADVLSAKLGPPLTLLINSITDAGMCQLAGPMRNKQMQYW